MKHKSILSVALALSVIVSMVSLPLSVSGTTTANRFTAVTGIINVGNGQVLRISVGGLQGNDTIQVRFAWMRYMPAGCNNDGVCLHTVQSQGITAPVTVGPGEAASFDVQGNGNGVRVGVFLVAGDFNHDGADALIINSATGEVVSQVIMANTAGDYPLGR
ncbi:MAG TPA: hypothetical protein VIF81_04455 [Pyrinomonadaceae bacterium]|jgi:hypothetical protein